MLDAPLAAVNDPEGDRIPPGLPPVVDAHVHIFPHPVFKAIWQWFKAYAWPIRYRMRSADLLQFLLERGVEHVVALQYAHKPGIARELNAYMADQCRRFKDRLTGMATVFPGEAAQLDILRHAFAEGLAGVKLHAHVQCFDLNSPIMEAIYEVCVEFDKPLIVHAGREPKSPAYPCDPYEICRAEKVENVLRSFPQLRMCVPHLGADEFSAYQRLIESCDNLWLDTAVALTDFLPIGPAPDIERLRPDRVMYGSDFPNLAYAWDRELKWIAARRLPPARLEQLLHGNAVEFLRLDPMTPAAAPESGSRRGPDSPGSRPVKP